MAREIINAYNETEAKLIGLIHAFDEQTINQIPFEESWTAGQVIDHITRAASNLSASLNGKHEKTDRNSEEKKEKIGKLFLDFSTKMKSPAFIEPAPAPHNKGVLLNDLAQKNKEIISALQSHDLDEIYNEREIPVFGSFTGKEWAWFIIYHTQRHIQQLEKIHEMISK